VDPGGGDSATMLAEFRGAGIDVDALASKLQAEGETSFVASWSELMKVIASKSDAVAKASQGTNARREEIMGHGIPGGAR
jgi:hypothetical protein